jgi:hypothetical protein
MCGLPTLSRVQADFSNAGVRPGGRATLVSVKVAKPMLAVLWPFGFPVRFANTGGAQTRGAWPESSRRAQTMRAYSPMSAALLGHTTKPGEITETMSSLIMENQLAMLKQGPRPDTGVRTRRPVSRPRKMRKRNGRRNLVYCTLLPTVGRNLL